MKSLLKLKQLSFFTFGSVLTLRKSRIGI